MGPSAHEDLGPPSLPAWAFARHPLGMKTYTLLAALLLLAGAASADPVAELREQRLDVLARVEGVSRLLPNNPGNQAAAALRRRLEGVRAGAQDPQADPARLAARRQELEDIEADLIAFLYETRPRGAGVSFQEYAQGQRDESRRSAAAARAELERSSRRVEDFAARLLAESQKDPGELFDGPPGLRSAAPAPGFGGGFVPGLTLPSALPPAGLGATPPARQDPRPEPPSPDDGLAALRTRLLARGVSAHIIDTAIAEGRRQKVDPVFVLSLIEQESGYNRMAHNKGSGCRGLMQLAPATAEDMGVRGAVADPSKLFNVGTNIRAGVRYIDWIANKFFRMGVDLSDVSRVPKVKLQQILAAYNWGIGNVLHTVRRYGAAALERIAPRETRDYISEIPGRISGWVDSFFH